MQRPLVRRDEDARRREEDAGGAWVGELGGVGWKLVGFAGERKARGTVMTKMELQAMLNGEEECEGEKSEFERGLWGY